jgi:osmotically-inducible protein OsmY
MNQNNDRHQQGSQGGRNRQSRQGFAQQGQEDASYRYSGFEGDDFSAGRGSHLQGFERGQAGRQGEYAQRLGHGSPGMGGQPGYGFGQSYGGYGSPQAYGGYEGASQFGSRPSGARWDERGMGGYSPEYMSQGSTYPQAGNPYMGNPYAGNQYIGTQSGYPGSGFQGAGVQGYGGGSLGGQPGYGPSSYGPSSYGQSGYGSPSGQSGLSTAASESGAYGASQYGYGPSSSPQSAYGQSGALQQAQQAGQSQRGRGPKGYTRSDDRIKEDVCERLSDDYLIDASDVSIEVRQGVVTLSGAVDSRQHKHRIEDIVEGLSGVKDIENRLTVRAQQRSGSTTSQAGAGTGTTGSAGTASSTRPS